jgi:hypothetical protein
MNTMLHALSVLDAPRRQRDIIDGYHMSQMSDYGLRIKFGYRIVEQGQCGTQVCITRAWLVNREETQQEHLPLTIFSRDDLIDRETEIGKEIDKEKT